MEEIRTLKNNLFAACKRQYTEKECSLVAKACEIGEKYLEDIKIEGLNLSTVKHNLKVATIVVDEINLDVNSTVSSVLAGCDLSPESIEAEKVISENFSPSVAGFIRSLNKIVALDFVNVQSNAEKFRNILVNISEDLRVVIIKLVDRLISMRELDEFTPEWQNKLSVESMFLYAPLAHRMGLYNIYTELSNRSFQNINTGEYDAIKQQLDDILIKNKDFLPDFISPIEKKLKELGVEYQIKQRIKSPFSIWKKLDKQHIGIEDIYDIYAIRVIFDTSIEKEKFLCWQIYAYVTDIYPQMFSRTRDWISKPRSNGYESLHTTVQYSNGVWVEVQIRSKRMDKVAEYGPASHWSYKDGTHASVLENWLAEIRDIVANDKLALGDILESMKPDSITNDQIYVFTPDKKIKNFNRGATLLDFAYDIHSDVGNKCVGGIINETINVDKSYKLKNGDTVFVRTLKTQRPSIEWLKISTSAKAKYNIRKTLNEERNNLIDLGKDTLKRKLKNWKYDFNDKINDIVQYFGYKYGADLYYDIATEKLNTLKIKEFLDNKAVISSQKQEQTLVKTKEKTGTRCLVNKEDGKRIQYMTCNCCEVKFGDKVFGFISSTAEIKIHSINCPNAGYLMSRFPYRILNVEWRE